MPPGEVSPFTSKCGEMGQDICANSVLQRRTTRSTRRDETPSVGQLTKRRFLYLDGPSNVDEVCCMFTLKYKGHLREI